VLNLTNMTDDKTIAFRSENVTFTAYWTYNGGLARLLVSNNLDFTNCNYLTTTGCLCASSTTTSENTSCQYTIQHEDPIDFVWYGRVCGASECTDVIREYNFSGMTSPSSMHIATFNATSGLTGIMTGTEADDTNYTRIASSDDVRWNYSTSKLGVYEWIKFDYNLNISPNSINYMHIFLEGFGALIQSSPPPDGIALYVWKDDTEWLLLDSHFTAATDRVVEKKFYETVDYSDYVNDTTHRLNVLVYSTKASAGEQSETVRVDYTFINLTIGGGFRISSTVQYALTVNNSLNYYVHVPFQGGYDDHSASFGSGITYTNLDHFYIASYGPGTLTALATSIANYISVASGALSNNHTVTISQNITPQKKVFLVLAEGDWHQAEKRADMIESGGFLNKIKPRFGFGLGQAYPLKILLNYTNLDIRNSIVLQRGRQELVIDYNDTTSDNRPALFIK